MADRPIYGIAICGGALGLELGLEAAIPGYRTAVVVERETSVAGRMGQRIKERSLPELAWWDDVGTFDGRPWRGIIQVVSAGFPCQPWSVAGKRGGKDDERWIWPRIAEIIEEIEPEIVFLENVPGLLLQSDSDVDRWDLDEPSEDALGGFGTVLRDLARLGFDAEWTSIRASDVGASHGRKRVFILAYRDGSRLWRYADGGGSEGQGIHVRSARPDEAALVADRRDGDLENPTRSGEHGCDGQAGRDGRRGILETGEQLGDSESGGFGELREPSRCVGLANRPDQNVEHAPCTESPRLGAQRDILLGPPDIFAPGPFARWEDVLVRFPWLRPSYSQAEAESDLRDVADGMASLVAHERTGALRALGNGVVPLQAAVAFTVLLRRAVSAHDQKPNGPQRLRKAPTHHLPNSDPCTPGPGM